MSYCGPKVVRRQRGMALIVAVLIASLVSIFVIEASSRFDLAQMRSANRWYGMQADAYLRGAEGLAEKVLLEDLQNTQYDHLAEIWAQEQPPFATDEGGYIAGVIEDAQGRFNLNLLMEKASANPGAPIHQRFTEHQKRFIRLLQTIELEEETFLDEPQAIAITEAVIDWIDADNDVTGFGGAEADYYTSLEPAMIIANRQFVSVSELRVIRGMTPQLYQGLLPLVIALPDTQATMNVNTMLVPLLRSLNEPTMLVPLTVEDAELLVEGRGEDGFENIGEFRDSQPVSIVFGATGNNQPNIDTIGLATASDYFIFFGEVGLGDHVKRGRALMQRTADEVITLRRTDANF